jgi:hypothetical protein
MTRVPKKVHFAKKCDLCKKHGGAHKTHSTGECRKYEKDETLKASFRAAKKGGKKSYPSNQNFAQLTEKIEKLEKALKTSGKRGKKRRYEDSYSNSKQEVGSGSTRKIIKLGETIKNTSNTPPSPIKATPTSIASKPYDVSTASVSEAGDVMMASSDQKGKLLREMYYIPIKDPPEGKTTAIVAVMRGRSKHDCPRQGSDKHYKRKLVRVLLDSGSDGDIIFIDKDKPMLLPTVKRLVPQSWNTSSGRFQTTRKAGIGLNFFEYSDSKRYLAAPDIVEYSKINRPQYDIILGVKTMKESGIILDFKDKMIIVDEIKLPMRNINYLQGSSTIHVLRLNQSLAMEPQSTQDATKRVTRILDAKYQKADLQSIVTDNCKHLITNQQAKLLQLLTKYESLFDGTLGDWKTKPVSFELKEGVSPYHGRAFPVPKSPEGNHQKGG